MTARLAHQDPADVAAYKRAGWWGEATVGELVARWAVEQPDALAYVADDVRMTWREYDTRASRLARALVGTGLPRDARIAVLLPDGAAVHVAFVAAERAGLTLVGLGHRAGGAEIRHIVGKTGASGLITLAEHRGRPANELVAELVGGGLAVDQHVVVAADGDGDPVVNGETGSDAGFDGGRRAFGADDLFIINSTSGTTGMPKCVLHNQNRWFFFGQDTWKVTSKLTINYGLRWEIYRPQRGPDACGKGLLGIGFARPDGGSLALCSRPRTSGTGATTRCSIPAGPRSASSRLSTWTPARTSPRSHRSGSGSSAATG